MVNVTTLFAIARVRLLETLRTRQLDTWCKPNATCAVPAAMPRGNRRGNHLCRSSVSLTIPCISYYTVVPLCTTVHTALHSPKFTGLCVTLQWNSNSIHLHPYQALTRLEEGSYKGLSDTLAACRCPATCTSQVLPRRASAVMGCLSRAPTITYSTRTHCTVRKKKKKKHHHLSYQSTLYWKKTHPPTVIYHYYVYEVCK